MKQRPGAGRRAPANNACLRYRAVAAGYLNGSVRRCSIGRSNRWVPESRLATRLAEHVPTALVDEVLVATGRVQQRTRRLPARVTVLFVLALTLFSGLGYRGGGGN